MPTITELAFGQVAEMKRTGCFDLSDRGLTVLPRGIGQYASLRELRLDHNRLTGLPRDIVQLRHLQALILDDNVLAELPPDMAQLTSLRELRLSHNRLTSLPSGIAQLSNLQTLILDNNELAELPPDIAQLTSLRELRLSHNRLTSLPSGIAQLSNLQTLILDNNELAELPPDIAQLTSLRELRLDHNRLTSLPSGIAQLSNLQTLILDNNELAELPPDIAQLTSLRELRLDHNRLTSLPSGIAQLSNLQNLTLDDNELAELPLEIDQLTNLQSLTLRRNKLVELPLGIADRLDAGLMLKLDNNPLAEPLPKLVQQGLAAVAVYLRSLRDSVRQYEAKVLLVGEGNVGKTSLSASLRGEAFVKDRPFTHGIQIEPLRLEHPKSAQEMTIRIWDFGGQEVYRVTHQFFFSQRALYVVVWKPREGQEQNEVEGWLRRIRLRVGPAAPVLIVATHCIGDQRPDLDYPQLRREFPHMLMGHFEVDNETGYGISELRDAISREAARLPQMGQRISSRWAAVRDQIINLSQTRPQVSFQEFTAICQHHQVGDSEIGTLSALMHDLGQIIYYGEDEGLQDFVVLNPEWLTQAISYVLRDDPTRQSGGILQHARLRTIWQAGPYPHEYHRYFLRLMERFDISYRLDDEQRSLVAQLVPYQRPSLPWDFRTPLPNSLRRLKLICRLSESAPGLMAWLTVRHHRAATGRHWRSGVFLRHPIPAYSSEALLELHDPTLLMLEVRAPSPDLFFHVLADSIEVLITSRWPGLTYQFFIPCPREDYGGSQCSGKFSLDGLRRLRERGLTLVPCLECGQEHEIELLLTGFASATQPLAAEIQQQLTRVEDRLVRIEGQAADMAAAIRRVLRVVSTEIPDCPSLFTLAQDRQAGDRLLRFFRHHYRLTLWCQHPGYWHPWGRASYELGPARDWLAKISPYAILIFRTLQLVVPLTGSIAVASLPADQIESATAHLEMMKTIVDDLPSTTHVSLAEDLDQNLADGKMTLAEGEALRTLRMIIFRYDALRRFGGLRRMQTPSGDFLWICPNHAAEYDPGLPAVP